jgi:class 3 adenylate cyclase
VAIHTATRVSALGQAGEVLVSGTVPDLVAGFGIVVDERGEHELKGIPRTSRVLAVGA